MTGLTIRLVSINIWDLPIRLPRTQRASREHRLLDGLPRLDADLVLIQEAFRPRLRRAILGVLAALHADAHARDRRWVAFLPLDAAGGLLTLSRWPIAHTRYQPARRFRRMKLDERIGQKGCLWTRIATPAGELLVGNVHLYAGNTPLDAHVRTIQTRDLLFRGDSRPALPTVIAGDCNWDLDFEHSERGPTGHVEMLQAGFREVADGRSEGIATMDPRHNAFARYVPWHRPVRRLTHVYYRGPGIGPGPTPPGLCLHEPPVSDHYGLRATLTLRAMADGRSPIADSR
jgi:endonuclease/exonuclease/phosphatase family metal-dependent hydrolase